MTVQLNAIVDDNSVLSPTEERERHKKRMLRIAILRGTIHLWSLGYKERSEVERVCRATLTMFPDVQEAIDFLATSETVVDN